MTAPHVYASKYTIVYAFVYHRFPWGGEKCDQLIMSRWFYSIQVSLLVLSNLAMIPGILYCYRCGLTALMTALTFAALSSGFYHLCDTDTFCIAEMSFHSLQVSYCSHCVRFTKVAAC